MSRRYLVFSTRAYAAMARQIAASMRWPMGKVEVRDFPDGERYQRIDSAISDAMFLLIGGTISDADTLELYDLACAMAKYGAGSLDLGHSLLRLLDHGAGGAVW